MRRGAPARRPVGAPGAASGEGAPAQVAVRAWVRLLSVQKRALSAIREDLEREMTMPRFDLLSQLVRSDGQTLASLARGMMVSAGNLSGLVARASHDGLLERRADPSDRRAWRVHLTPKGLKAFRAAEGRHAARVTKVFATLGRAELATLTRLLDKVRHGLRDPEPASVATRRRPPPRAHEGRGAPSRRRKTPKKDPS